MGLSLYWTGIDSSNRSSAGERKRPAVDLVDFIQIGSLEKTKKIGIDLRKFTGIANSKIELKIHLNHNLKNLYNISSELTNAGLKIFNDNLELHNAKINGVFDGEQVYLDGKGKINNFDSDLIYRYNFTDQSEYQQLLKIKTAVKTQNQKVGLIKVLSGSSFLNFEYKVRDEKAHINTNTNLKFKVEEVRLKNNIYLDNVMLLIKCDKTRCFKGY